MMLDDSCQVIAHYFSDGVYFKHVVLRSGYKIKQHVHKYDHMAILVNGSAMVETASGIKTYYGLSFIEIKAGVAHSVAPLTGDVDWICCHRTDCTDVDEVDEVVCVPHEAA